MTNKIFDIISDEKESELVASTERGEWTSVGSLKEQKQYWTQLAESTLDRKRHKNVS